MRFDSDRPDVDELAQQADELDPIVGTPVLDKIAQFNHPLRGEFRQRVLNRVRIRVKQRRTPDGVAKRVSSGVDDVVGNPVRDELKEVTRDRAENVIERISGGES